MSLNLVIPSTTRSFKEAFHYRPFGYRTPSPPIDAFEPTSPLREPPSSLPNPTSTATSKKRKFQGPEAYGIYPVGSEHGRRHHSSSNHGARHPSAEFSHRRSTSHHAQASPTPLDVFATVAISPSLGSTNEQTFADPLKGNNDIADPFYRNQDRGATPPSQTPQWQSSSFRSSKRSRSEVIDSNSLPYSTMRPSTSHIPQSTWLNQRHHLHYAERYSGQQRQELGRDAYKEALPDNTVKDAELLLLFSRGQNTQQLSQPSPTLQQERHVLDKRSDQLQNGYAHSDSNYRYVEEQKQTWESFAHDHSNQVVGRQYQGYNADDSSMYGGDYTSHVPDQHQIVAEDAMLQSIQETKLPVKSGRGWPKGKPRGRRPKNGTKAESKTAKYQKVTTPKKRGRKPKARKSNSAGAEHATDSGTSESAANRRRHSISGLQQNLEDPVDEKVTQSRSASAPPTSTGIGRYVQATLFGPPPSRGGRSKSSRHISVCTSCKSYRNSLNGFHDFWVCCNGCKSWFHHICVGFKSEREVRDVDKFYCKDCQPKHGPTTFVRKSSRAHASVDYAGLNEGKLRTSTDVPEHHYIKPIKDGTIEFTPETFPRMRPELVTADFFQKSGTMSEPILIPAWMNPRPRVPAIDHDDTSKSLEEPTHNSIDDIAEHMVNSSYEYDCVFDDGQDKLDMVIPQGLTVRRAAELYGPEEKVEVIDVKSQEGEDKRWNMRQWAEYYEAEGEKPVRNVISLEVSASKLGRLIQRPKIVRDLDLQDAVWPRDEMAKGVYPRVQFYCLMSVADCYTDFHIDFGGSSVYYHILKGRKTFFFIPPKKQHLKKYEEWCLSSNQGSTFLGHETKECYRVDLYEGDTMLIPSGWIHAVWTPENSLVIGGNFLTRMHYGMQIQINDIEKNTGVARKFRYPFFQKVLWYAAIDYLQEDPIPSTVVQSLYTGGKFERSVPVYEEYDQEEDYDEVEYSNARYYSRGEIEGLPDLLRYILRTVMISLGKIPGVSKTTQEAVVRSLPKGYGDPVDLVKTFAMWIAWKNGNEEIPHWAHPEANIPDAEPLIAEKKQNTGPRKKGERRSSRQIANEQTKENVAPSDALVLQAENAIAKDTLLDPTPSVRRLACEACRQRRIRCKHKEDLGSAPEVPQRFGVRTILPPQAEVVIDGPDAVMATTAEDIPEQNTTIVHDIKQQPEESTPTTFAVVINQEPVQPVIQHETVVAPHSEDEIVSPRKQAKARACVECRKSKRRCIHDENGAIDPVKAQESPIPRSSLGTKRVRGDSDTESANTNAKKIKAETEYDTQQFDASLPDATFTHEVSPSSLSQGDSKDREIAKEHANEVESQVQREALNNVNHSTFLLETQSPAEDTSPAVLRSNGEFAGTMIQVEDDISAFHNDVAEEFSDAQTPARVQYSLIEAEKAIAEGQSSENTAAATNKIGDPLVDETSKPDSNRSDNRSRTPSSHVQTNVTESVHASTSPPTSPLTDLDPASPGPEQSNGVRNKRVRPAASERSSRTPRERKQVERFASTSFDNKPEAVVVTTPRATPRATSEASSRTPGTKKRSMSTNDQKSTKPVYKGSVISKDSNESPVQAASRKFASHSPLIEEEDDDDDESTRLARSLQEQEFGLRRRKAV